MFSSITVHKSQLSTTDKEPTVLVIQHPLLRFRRQNMFPPKRTFFYNPNSGYEPYWPDGGWVFNRLDITTEKADDTICGNECLEMYKEFGEICGRNKYNVLKTFKNYCELLDEDCTDRDKWMIAYRGVCVLELKLYPTGQTELLTRAFEYDNVFESINPDEFYTRLTTAKNTTSSTTAK